MTHDANEVQMQNILDRLTDAIRYDEDEAGQIMAEARQVSSDMPTFIRLIHRLNMTLQPQEPSERFVRQLHHELVGERPGLIHRVRTMPGRVQIATGIAAALAGIMWISRRRIYSQGAHLNETSEVPALQ